MLERVGVKKAPDLSNSPDIQRGNKHEERIVNGAGMRLLTNFTPACFEEDIKGIRCLYSSDGVCDYEEWLVEAKCPRKLPESAKQMHVAQCHWGMGIAGIHRCVLVYQTSSGDYLEYPLKFQKDYFTTMVEQAVQFLQEVEDYSDNKE